MAITSYSGLVAGISDWMARDDAREVAPDFIRMVEEEINSLFKSVDMETTASVSVASGGNTIALPSDYREAISLTHTGNPQTSLQRAPLAVLKKSTSTLQKGRPTYFCDFSATGILLAPIADSAYTFTLNYKRSIPALNDANPTNWLLQKNSMLYLYGCLRHAAMYVKDFNSAAFYLASFEQAKTALHAADNRRRTRGGAKMRPAIGVRL